MENKKFDVPIVLFIFKRSETVLRILHVLKEIEPTTIYLVSDYGRNDSEKKYIDTVREIIEGAINWDCKIIKRYQEENIGVYRNIVGGAHWVFQQEESAIFLEDDNLPANSFFSFCKELLNKYKEDPKILWICGSNYLEESEPLDGASYFFSQNMLPCGWASWRDKFLQFYDGELKLFDPKRTPRVLKPKYLYKKLFYQDIYNFNHELAYKKKNNIFYSWDYQMAFSLRFHDMYSIIPKFNQIQNIGVDEYSTHGGQSMQDIMVERFCENKIKNLTFPLIHPTECVIDSNLDKELAKLIYNPNFFSIKSIAGRVLRKIFHVNITTTIKRVFKLK